MLFLRESSRQILYLSLPQYFPLTVSDYLLGLSDLTGELMRFAISGLSSHKGGRAKATQVCAFVRACKAGEQNDQGLWSALQTLKFTPHVDIRF